MLMRTMKTLDHLLELKKLMNKFQLLFKKLFQLKKSNLLKKLRLSQLLMRLKIFSHKKLLRMLNQSQYQKRLNQSLLLKQFQNQQLKQFQRQLLKQLLIFQVVVNLLVSKQFKGNRLLKKQRLQILRLTMFKNPKLVSGIYYQIHKKKSNHRLEGRRPQDK